MWLRGAFILVLTAILVLVTAAAIGNRAWVLVTTSGFEYVPANREDLDHRPTFQPNSVLADAVRCPARAE